MSQPTVYETTNNVRKKRIIQEVIIKIEMTGGYIENGEGGQPHSGSNDSLRGTNGEDAENKSEDGSLTGHKEGEGEERANSEESKQAKGAEGAEGVEGAEEAEGEAGNVQHGNGTGEDGQDIQDNQNNQGGGNQDDFSRQKSPCPNFASCAEVLKNYSYSNSTDAADTTKQDGQKTQEQIDAEKAADKFISTGPNLERCSPTTECDPDNSAILKYRSVCPDEDLPAINEDDLEYDENKLVRLNWKKVKRFLRAACPSRKLKLLQALRLRLSDQDTNIQEKTARDIVKHDLFDVKQLCCGKSLFDDLLWPPSVSLPHPVQNSSARLLNALVSQDIGRDYLKDVSIIQTLTWGRSLRAIAEHSEHTTVDVHTGNMIISAIMKLSVLPFQRKDMVRKGLLKWLIIHFDDVEQQASSYHLEYASALLMMLLTVPNAVEFVLDQTRQLLAFFIRTLKVPGNTSWPYIRLAMLTLFRNPKIASNAKQLNLPNILNDFLFQTNDKTEKQSIGDVLNQLDNPASTSMDDITNQANVLATDKLYLDEEINKSDPVNCLPDRGGEDLLKIKFACKKSKKKEIPGTPEPKHSNNSIKKSPCQLKNCMKSKENRAIGSKSYNETTHSFEKVPNKDEIFPRSTGKEGSVADGQATEAETASAQAGPAGQVRNGIQAGPGGQSGSGGQGAPGGEAGPGGVQTFADQEASSVGQAATSTGKTPQASLPQSTGGPSPSNDKAGAPVRPDVIVQNVEIKQQITSPLTGEVIGGGEATKIYSDSALNITTTKVMLPEPAKPGLNFNIRPLRNNEKNRTLKIVCNTDTDQTDNFLCTVYEMNGDENEDTLVSTATISKSQNNDGTITATVNQNMDQ